MANGEAISRRPLSPARLPANRRHAQKSTGPKTMAGNAALDARRLGLAPPEIERHQKPEPVPNHREGMRLIGEDVPTRRHRERWAAPREERPLHVILFRFTVSLCVRV